MEADGEPKGPDGLEKAIADSLKANQGPGRPESGDCSHLRAVAMQLRKGRCRNCKRGPGLDSEAIAAAGTRLHRPVDDYQYTYEWDENDEVPPAGPVNIVEASHTH